MRKFLLYAAMGTLLHAGQCNIGLDIGHTPKNPGAHSARGVGEYAFNRRAALHTYYALQHAGINAFFINDEEREIGLKERTKEAERYGATHFISIHHDSVKERYLKKWVYNGKQRRYSNKFSGYSIFVSKKNKHFQDSLDLASAIGDNYRHQGMRVTPHHNEDIPGERKAFLNKEAGVYRYDNLVVLKTADMPSILIECGIIINKEDEEELWSEEHLKKISSGIVEALRHKCTN